MLRLMCRPHNCGVSRTCGIGDRPRLPVAVDASQLARTAERGPGPIRRVRPLLCSRSMSCGLPSDFITATKPSRLVSRETAVDPSVHRHKHPAALSDTIFLATPQVLSCCSSERLGPTSHASSFHTHPSRAECALRAGPERQDRHVWTRGGTIATTRADDRRSARRRRIAELAEPALPHPGSIRPPVRRVSDHEHASRRCIPERFT